MQITDYINNTVNRFQAGYVFTYTDFPISVEKTDAVLKALNRMVESGKLRKLSKGRYYKPKMTEFGELKPDINQVVKDLLEKDGKIQGYLTGYSAYNELGLTTQLSNTIQIGVNTEKKAITRGMYKIKFIKQANRITKENSSLLRILDSIRYIKEIPDTTLDISCERIILLIKKLSPNVLNTLVKLSLNYTASSRALTGALIETACDSEVSQPIFESLNQASNYKYKISDNTLTNKQKWNIQ